MPRACDPPELTAHSPREATGLLRLPITIATVGFCLRIVVALLAYAGKDVVSILWPRGVEALGIARSLLTGHGFSSPFPLPTGPTAFLPPVYPFILAAIEKLFGLASTRSAWVILIMQCAFSAATCIPIYGLASNILGHRVAKRAAWIWALFPYAIVLPTNIIWESSFSALVLICGLLSFRRAQFHDSLSRWVLLGIYWAFACLLNAAFLLLLPALLVYTVLFTRNLSRQSICCGIAFVACLLPWTLRNYVVMHKLFPIRDNFALEFWLGNHQGSTSGFIPEIHPAFSSEELHRYQQLGELAYMREKGSIAREYVVRQPSTFVANSLRRFENFWLPVRSPLWLAVPLLSLLGLAGFVLLISKRPPGFEVFVIPLLLYPAPYYLTHSDLRYAHPIHPLLAILAAYAVALIGKARLVPSEEY
jgi:4-amino-4-deoxy-L-arabinose transferase-like glycosyltransferase